jgi:hypothetical protein
MVSDRQRGEGREARTIVAVRRLLRKDVQRERVVVVVDEVDHRLLGLDDHCSTRLDQWGVQTEEEENDALMGRTGPKTSPVSNRISIILKA